MNHEANRYYILIMYEFELLANPTNEVVEKSAFILDDKTHAKTGRGIEQISIPKGLRTYRS